MMNLWSKKLLMGGDTSKTIEMNITLFGTQNFAKRNYYAVDSISVGNFVTDGNISDNAPYKISSISGNIGEANSSIFVNKNWTGNIAKCDYTENIIVNNNTYCLYKGQWFGMAVSPKAIVGDYVAGVRIITAISSNSITCRNLKDNAENRLDRTMNTIIAEKYIYRF